MATDGKQVIADCNYILYLTVQTSIRPTDAVAGCITIITINVYRHEIILVFEIDERKCSGYPCKIQLACYLSYRLFLLLYVHIFVLKSGLYLLEK